MKAKTIFLTVTLILLAVVLAGCLGRGPLSERALERTIEQQTGGQANVDINGDDASFKVETDDGSFEIGQDVKLPDDVPQYPGSQVISKATGSSEQGSGGLFSMTTNDSIDQVISYYQDYYTGQGWEQQAEMTFGGAKTVVFEKGEGNNISVSAAQNTSDGKTTVNLVISQEN